MSILQTDQGAHNKNSKTTFPQDNLWNMLYDYIKERMPAIRKCCICPNSEEYANLTCDNPPGIVLIMELLNNTVFPDKRGATSPIPNKCPV